jgi:hypothetical protein
MASSKIELNLEELGNKIRDFINDSTIIKTNVYLNKTKGYWEQLWACMDTLGDTEIAIKEFFKLSSDDFEKSPYLFLYGLLQSLILQQDSVINMKESLFGTNANQQLSATLFNVRNIRNLTIGHPTKNEKSYKGIKVYCTINRSTLSKNGFEYIIWKPSTIDSKSINFNELVDEQRKVLVGELEEILNKLKDMEKLHKQKFKGKKLATMLEIDELYSFQLLSQLSFDELGWRAFLHYKKNHLNIKSEIEKRYGKINETLRIPGTKLIIDELDFIFEKINLLKNNSTTNPFELDIYADRLVDKLKELKMHLDEIDQEFE